MEVSEIKEEAEYSDDLKVKEENSSSFGYKIESPFKVDIKPKEENQAQSPNTLVKKEEIQSVIFIAKPDQSMSRNELKLEPDSKITSIEESEIEIERSSDEEQPQEISQSSQSRPTKTKSNKNVSNRKKSAVKIQQTQSLQCSLCPRSFSMVDLLITHSRNKHSTVKNPSSDTTPDDEDETLVQCPLCPTSFKTVYILRCHFRDFHIKSKAFQCSICLETKNEIKTFPIERYLKDHIAKVHDPARFKFQCGVCSKKFTTANNYRIHRKIHTERKYKCEYCSKAYREKEGMLNHIIAAHREYCDRHETFKCSSCEELFSTQKDVEYHVLQTHATDTVECKICFKKFREERELTRHLTVSHKENRTWLVCDVCSRVFTNNDDLVQHLEVEHKRFFKCRKCFRSFVTKEEYDSHSTETFDKEGRNIEKSQLQCKVCFAFLQTECSLTTHKDAHLKTGEIGIKNVLPLQPSNVRSGPVKCDFCPIIFQKKSLVLKHAMECHPNEKLECKTCAKSFYLKCQLSKHELLHSIHKPFECKVCKKCFTSRIYLTKHGRVHKKHNYECSQCEKSFVDVRDFRAHVANNHGGEKPFKCPICKMAFAVKYYLDQHFLVHTDERRFSCTECSYSSKRGYELKAHQERLHLKNPKYMYKKGMSHPTRLGPHLKYFDDLVYICTLDECDFETKDEKEVASHNEMHGLPQVILSRELPCPLVKVLDASRLTRGEKIKTRTVQPRFKCKHCFKMFLLSANLKDHVLKVHSGPQNKKVRRVPVYLAPESKYFENLVFVCSVKQCGFETKDKKEVAIHYAKHNLPKVCVPRLLPGPSSEVVFSTSSPMIKDLIQTRYKCAQCFITVSSPSGLWRHTLRYHSGNKARRRINKKCQVMIK